MNKGFSIPDDWRPLSSDAIEEMIDAHSKKERKLNDERAYVIVGGVELETLLGDILFQFMVDDIASKDILNNTFSNFRARIQGAYCLGLISRDEYNDLNIIRAIRNIFAHCDKCSFDDAKTLELCANFRIPKQRPDLFKDNPPLQIFKDVQFVLTQNIYDRIQKANDEKRLTPFEIDSKHWQEFW